MSTAIDQDQIAEIRQALGILVEPGSVVELRAPKYGRYQMTLSGFFDDLDVLAVEAAKASGHAPGIYFTLNPIDPDLLARRANRTDILKKADEDQGCAKDKDILRRRWLFIDIDSKRKAGICATDGEHEAAIDCARSIYRSLSAEGWPEPLVVDSGNGAYLLYRIDLPAVESDGDRVHQRSLALVTGCLATLADRFGDDAIKIDSTVGNPARIARIPGTVNAKGDDIERRPHRPAKILHAPKSLEVVPEQLLQMLAEQAPKPAPPPKKEPTSQPRPGSFDVAAFVARHLEVIHDEDYEGGHRWVVRCPFDPDHTDKSAWVVRRSRGGWAAGCQHDSCTWDYKELREKFEPKASRNGSHREGNRIYSTTSPIGAAGDAATEQEDEARDGLTDAHLSQQFVVDELRGSHCWAAELGWMKWSGKVWERVPEEEVHERARLYLLERYRAAVADRQALQVELAEVEAEEAVRDLADAAGAPDKARKDQLRMLTATVRALHQALGRSRTVAVVRNARGIVLQVAAAFDAHPDLINAQNGILDLRTGKLVDHDPAYLMTKIAGAEYQPGATHPDWTQALTAVPEDVLPWWQIRLGQALTGYVPPDDVLVLQQGSGENGKTSVVAAICGAFGSYHRLIAQKALFADPSAHTTELTDFRGARLALMEETPEEHYLSVARLKATVGTTHITARYMRCDDITFPCTHSLFINSNYLPVIRETDHGTWRRLARMRFPYRYLKPGQKPETEWDRTGDPGLRDRLKDGAEGRGEAVLAWLVEGARRWYEANKVMPALPERVEQDTLDWRGKTDLILVYCTERLVFEQDRHVMSSELFEDFKEWISARGHSEWSQTLFEDRFANHELAVSQRLAKRRTRPIPGLCRRPGLILPSDGLPGMYMAWLGVRFRTASDTDDTPPPTQQVIQVDRERSLDPNSHSRASAREAVQGVQGSTVPPKSENRASRIEGNESPLHTLHSRARTRLDSFTDDRNIQRHRVVAIDGEELSGWFGTPEKASAWAAKNGYQLDGKPLPQPLAYPSKCPDCGSDLSTKGTPPFCCGRLIEAVKETTTQ